MPHEQLPELKNLYKRGSARLLGKPKIVGRKLISKMWVWEIRVGQQIDFTYAEWQHALGAVQILWDWK